MVFVFIGDDDTLDIPPNKLGDLTDISVKLKALLTNPEHVDEQSEPFHPVLHTHNPFTQFPSPLQIFPLTVGQLDGAEGIEQSEPDQPLMQLHVPSALQVPLVLPLQINPFEDLGHVFDGIRTLQSSPCHLFNGLHTQTPSMQSPLPEQTKFSESVGHTKLLQSDPVHPS